jgi:hypothetical protein
MSYQQEIGFISKNCKGDSHINCVGRWTGLGFNIKCICLCHDNNHHNFIDNIHDKILYTNSNPNVIYEHDSNQDKSNDYNTCSICDKNQISISGKRSAKLYFPLALLGKSHTYIKSGGDSTHV